MPHSLSPTVVIMISDTRSPSVLEINTAAHHSITEFSVNLMVMGSTRKRMRVEDRVV